MYSIVILTKIVLVAYGDESDKCHKYLRNTSSLQTGMRNRKYILVANEDERFGYY